MKSYHQAMAEALKTYLEEVLEFAGDNVTKAAEIAGVNRTHFYQLMSQNAAASHKFNTRRSRRRGNAAWISLGH